MTGGFEQRLEADLEALAAASAPPPPDLYAQVRARVDRRRRRRTAVLAGGVAACTATVLGLTLTFADRAAPAPTPSSAVPASGGAAGSSHGATAPSGGATTDTAWWPLADADLRPPPSAVLSGWDAAKQTTHSDARLLYQQQLDPKAVLFLVAGRTPDGGTRVALLLGMQGINGAVSRTGLDLLLDVDAPTGRSAPVALALLQGLTSKASASTLGIEVLATPCAGKAQVSLDGESTPLTVVGAKNGILVVKPLRTAGSPPGPMTLECAAEVTGISSARLTPAGHALVPGRDTTAYLLTGA
ncbi:hypothetical protein [Streptacidiphilus cavernicola]|uniref:Uncharacterized protein n=1 Tax=Streptacidiphilus cavernicola TaxID=3342716 RepID=A0ABV6W112_9ACTN